MKRLTHLVALLFLLSCSMTVLAEESTLFVKTIPITRISSHTLGFEVVYPKGDLVSGKVYLPADWFSRTASKGEIIWGNHASFPYMSIFYDNGKFSHVRLYLESDLNSPSWGRLPGEQDFSKEFAVETVVLK